MATRKYVEKSIKIQLGYGNYGTRDLVCTRRPVTQAPPVDGSDLATTKVDRANALPRDKKI